VVTVTTAAHAPSTEPAPRGKLRAAGGRRRAGAVRGRRHRRRGPAAGPRGVCARCWATRGAARRAGELRQASSAAARRSTSDVVVATAAAAADAAAASRASSSYSPAASASAGAATYPQIVNDGIESYHRYSGR
jgi:hypothetical protein